MLCLQLKLPECFLKQGAALVHVYTDGSVLLCHGGVEFGQGLNTKMIQVSGYLLKLVIKRYIVLNSLSLFYSNKNSDSPLVNVTSK